MIFGPNQIAYFEEIQKNLFNEIDEQKEILEIGPFDGWFTDLILTCKPKKLTLVEPNVRAVEILKNKYKECSDTVEIINDDVFNQFKILPKNFDVVIAFGVIYHFASPFEFLEQIVNKLQPNILCLDNPIGGSNQICVMDEVANTPGNRFSNEKTVGMSIHINHDVIMKAMTNLGYKSAYYRCVEDLNIPTKENTYIYKFIKNDIQQN